MTAVVDSNVFIYALNAHPEFGPGALHFLKLVESGVVGGVASELVYLEVLSGKELNIAGVSSAQQLLTRSGMLFVPVTMAILLEAAELRRQLGVSTPDAIHLATALAAGASHFVTNDHNLLKKEVAGLELVSLSRAVTLLSVR